MTSTSRHTPRPYPARRRIDHTMARNRYTLFHFLLDVLLTVITGGFWLIWIFVREMRRRR